MIRNALVALSLLFFMLGGGYDSDAQTPADDYKAQWEAVKAYEKKGKSRSALKEVEKIYALASSQKDDPQATKAVIYTLKLMASFEEEYLVKGVKYLDEVLAGARSPMKEIIYSLKAEMLWKYYQDHRRSVMEREKVDQPIPDDMALWSYDDFAVTVNACYRKSLNEALQTIPVKAWAPILLEGKDQRLRPTLYDFLAFRALTHFANPEAVLNRSVHEFAVDEPQFLANYKTFLTLDLQTEQKSAAWYYLSIMQKLMRFHASDVDPSALVDADLIRLRYVYDNSSFEQRDEDYLSNLMAWFNHEGRYDILAEAGVMAANMKANATEKEGCPPCEAIALCEEVINRFPHTQSAKEAQRIREGIEAQRMVIQLPERVPSNTEELFMVSVANVDHLYFRVIPLDHEEYGAARGYHEEPLPQRYLSQKAVTSWDEAFSIPKDYQTHYLELPLPPLPYGYYALLVSPSAEFDEDGVLAFTQFQVTDMSPLFMVANEETQLQVKDGWTGLPLEGVTVAVFRNDYRRGRETMAEGVTDKEGAFSLKGVANKYNTYVRLAKGKDVLISPISGGGYYQSPHNISYQSWIFPDRAVYRPGQTLSMKLLLTQRREGEVMVAPGKSVRVELLDLNYQVRDERSLTTGDYGTLQGTFVIPPDIPTGNMILRTPYGSRTLQVEEYKRPSFEITFDEEKPRAHQEDPMVVAGRVQTYSGVPLEELPVKYRVIRSAYFPWRWWPGPYVEGQKEVALGVAHTDEEGAFTLSFVPSPKKEGKDFFGYTYTVEVVVTDRAGETHEQQKTLWDVVKKMVVKADLPEVLFTDGEEEVRVEVLNSLDSLVACEGSLTVEKLKVPEKAYRERLWSNKPDIFLLERAEFVRRFPLDYVEPPLPYSAYESEQSIFSSPFDKGKIVLKKEQMRRWDPGIYRLVVQAVSGEDTASLRREFVVVDPSSNHPSEKKIFEAYFKDVAYEPGDTASLLVSSAGKMQLHYLLNDGNMILDQQVISLDHTMKALQIPIKEAYRGNIFATLYATLDGRTYKRELTIHVPYTHKKLNVEFLSFREVTEPGSEESWKLKVTDFRGTPVEAEMLVAMYDRSLDVIAPLDYHFFPFVRRYSTVAVDAPLDGLKYHGYHGRPSHYVQTRPNRHYDRLLWSPFMGYGPWARQYDLLGKSSATVGVMNMIESEEFVVEEDASMGVKRVAAESPSEQPAVVLRKDFRETAFFYPMLKTDKEGLVDIAFTAPDAVTGWKVQGLVHTGDLKNAVFDTVLVTRKEVMITPNMPRFVRQGDELVLEATIHNLQGKSVEVEALLELFDPETGQSLNQYIAGKDRNILEVPAEGSVASRWTVQLPDHRSFVGVRVYAKAGHHQDGEEHVLSILPSQTLVTESLPVSMGRDQTRGTFTFEKLLKEGDRRDNFALTLEYTANPVWYALQALPVLEAGVSKDASTLFGRYYANALASHIAHSNPRIKRIFDQWRSRSSEALLSVLEKNKELKMTLLQESPWLAEAKDETEQKYRIALLFDMNRIAQMKSETWAKLQEMQYPDGSWPWFEGMRPSLFTTLSVVESYARLYALGVEQDVPHEMVKAASFLDEKAQEAYRTMMDEEGFDPADKHLPPFVVSWLYARSLLGDHLNSVAEQEWYRFYSDQLKEHWLSLGLYQQSLAAIILYYNVEPDLAEEIIASLKERAILSDQRGMYWRELNASPYWYRAPIATMASLIEAFTLISGGEESVSLMKKWLLSQKQTNRWNSDIGTIHAIYALLLEGDEMLSGSNEVEITLGDELVVDGTDPKEPGTGYVKKVWHGEEVQSSMGEMQVNSSSDRFSWGALYWQYYAPYDEIEAAGNGLTISRKRYQKINTSKGPKYVEIKEEDRVKKGDRVVVRMQVTADRDYSFVHLKDQRSAAYEPVENRSGYRYQNGRGYYLSIRDASMNYYFDFLPKGTYLFEYELFKVRDGVYTGGLSTIQCVYAPEFNAHSSGF
ncbi:MAG: hypothetical protein CSA95_07185 [Bacteroidetes bacterium]|nr:MAG: hypothetical protein CSA95_07185 [Bacteroidota bacterium]